MDKIIIKRIQAIITDVIIIKILTWLILSLMRYKYYSDYTFLIIFILYYFSFSYSNNGQTIGKKLFGIRILNKSKSNYFVSLLIRCIMIFPIAQLFTKADILKLTGEHCILSFRYAFIYIFIFYQALTGEVLYDRISRLCVVGANE